MRPPRASLACALALTLGAVPLAAQSCPEGMPRTAYLGIQRFECRAGSCVVNLRKGASFTHDFTVEPSVHGILPGGPSEGVLQEGDVITSVDGDLITTHEGGRRLANLEAGRAVVLGIRRGGAELSVRVVPAPGCNTPGLIVHGGAEVTPPGTLPAGGRPAVHFGMELECAECGWLGAPGGTEFRSGGPVRVRAVERGGPADRAGIRPGDVLVAVDALPFGSPDAARHLGALRPGAAATFRVRRGEQELELKVTAAAPAAQPF